MARSKRFVGPVTLFVPLAALLLAGRMAHAVDVPLPAKSLTIRNATASGGKSKVTFVARDRSGSLTKGDGTDPGDIRVGLRVIRYNAEGGFTIPAGARPIDGSTGWIKNDARAASFVNRDADLGSPTGVSRFSLINGSSLKLTGRTIGDASLASLTIPYPDARGILTVVTVENGGDVLRYCTVFWSRDITFRSTKSGDRSLKAKNGEPYPCPPEVLQPAPLPALPSVPSAPSLWFDGNNPAAVAAIVARTTDPETSALFGSIRGSVDGSLGSLVGASDDTLARVAKGAGLLQVVGLVPSGGSGFPTYRDVVVAAVTAISDRTATDSIGEFLNPPANVLNVLQDAGRLQSMAEAFDLVRGSGVAPAEETAMADRIANWADELLLDWNLVGDSFGIFAGHRDNWSIKAGSAVVTAALAVPEHPNAAQWLATGVQWIEESLAAKVLAPGWYAESPHYLNYSLNNLASTLWHLYNATGTDWFDDLEPLLDIAFALRQPDGLQPPFEEGVPTTVPWDVLAAAYPARASTMMWALANSPADYGSYENQQFHAVTRFLVRPLGVTPAMPADAPTRFVDGNTHAVILRSDWSADALQVTGLTAIDTSSDESVASRHHMENPLDLVLHGAGATLLPTASGGPTVTTSPDRSYFLLPSSKNIPLVDENAPYVLDPLGVELEETIDSRDAGIRHRLLDAATTTVTRFAAGVDVARTLAMIDDSYAVVVDRFAGEAAHSFGTNWRGRGSATLRVAGASHVAADYDWPNSASPLAHLAIDTTGSAPLSGALVTGYYAPAFGSEETLAPLSVRVSASEATLLTVLRPRTNAAPASTVTPLTAVGGAAASVISGSTNDVLLAGAEGVVRSAAGVEGDGRLTLVRKVGAEVSGIAATRATRVASGPVAIEATAPTTFAATVASGTAVITLGSDAVAGSRLTLTALPGLTTAASHTVTFDGAPVPTADVTDDGTSLTIRIPGPGTLVVSD